MLAEHLKEFDQPGAPGVAAMLISAGRAQEVFVCGLADVETGTPITPNTNFRLASVSKQFTAMAVLMLVATGKLSVEDEARRHLPELPALLAGVRVRHMLNHTSGLEDYEPLASAEVTRQLVDRDVLDLVAGHPARMFAPGDAFHYSNTAYALLALIVERVSGADFATYLRESIFGPLGMRNTLARQEGGPPVPQRAYGYSRRGDQFARTDQSQFSAVLGDGGIYSSLTDLLVWDQALYSAALVPPELLAQAFAPGVQLPDGSAGYGFGWYVRAKAGRTVVYHTGETIGFRNAFERCPGQQASVIVLSNRSNQRVPGIAAGLMDELVTARQP